MPLLLFILFIGFPLLELYVIIEVGGAIGTLPTIGLLLATGLVGAPLAASQGRAVWRRFTEALAAGRMPGREVFEGAMVIVAGALLLTPGFITDTIGLGLLTPPLRGFIYGRLTRRVAHSAGGPVFVWARTARGRPGSPPRPSPRRPYDVDGTAREVEDAALPPERGEGERE